MVSLLLGSEEFMKVPYGTEAGLFQKIAGIPSVVLGPGSIEQAHQVDEFIAMSEIAKAVNFLSDLVALAQNDKVLEYIPHTGRDLEFGLPRSRKKRTAHICFWVRGRLVPTVFPAFHAARPRAAASYREYPISVLLGHDWPKEERSRRAALGPIAVGPVLAINRRKPPFSKRRHCGRLTWSPANSKAAFAAATSPLLQVGRVSSPQTSSTAPEASIARATNQKVASI